MRDELIAAIYAAQTLSEIRRVQDEMDTWLEENPDDQEVRSLGEMLIIAEEALS